jgi:hypothetical protein
MDLNRLLGKQEGFERFFESYLSVLVSNQMPYMALEGGYAVVERTAMWGRLDEANTLLGVWVRSLPDALEIEAVLRFARAEARRGAFWPVIHLLLRFGDERCHTPEVRFERAALRYLCLKKLHDAVSTEMRQPQSFQIQMASRGTTAEFLAQALPGALAEAKATLGEVHELTSFCKDLKRQIEAAETLSPMKSGEQPHTSR